MKNSILHILFAITLSSLFFSACEKDGSNNNSCLYDDKLMDGTWWKINYQEFIEFEENKITLTNPNDQVIQQINFVGCENDRVDFFYIDSIGNQIYYIIRDFGEKERVEIHNNLNGQNYIYKKLY